MYNFRMKKIMRTAVVLAAIIFALSTAALALDYPKLYSEDLPRYPGATIVDAGRSSRNLRDGVRIKLETTDPLPDVVKFYEDALKAAGWTIPQKRFPNEQFHMGVYTKGKLQYTLNVMRMGAGGASTTIQISYHEK